VKVFRGEGTRITGSASLKRRIINEGIRHVGPQGWAIESLGAGKRKGTIGLKRGFEFWEKGS